MSDLICRKTMQRCQHPGMCSTHGGCQPDKGFESGHLDLGKFVDWVWSLKSERDQLKAENEALRKALSECIQSLAEEMLQNYQQKPEDMHPSTRRRYDLEMEELAGYRAAMAREASQ